MSTTKKNSSKNKSSKTAAKAAVLMKSKSPPASLPKARAAKTGAADEKRELPAPAESRTHESDIETKKPGKLGSLAATPPATTETVSVRDSERTPAQAGHRDPRLPAIGTVIVKRDRHGAARCECAVEERGIRYNGALYKSISAAARAAAIDLGVKGAVNGFVFFNLSKPNHQATPPAESLRKIASRYEERAKALVAAAGNGVADDVREELELHAATLADLLAKVAA